MNDCLSLPLRQGSGEPRVLGGWEAVWTSLGEGEGERLPAGRGEGWQPVQVPQQLAAREGRSAVWYRTSFSRPDHSGRVLVRFGGAFLAVNAWLNGKFLGSHYGYFAPFGFDLTPSLKDENLLVVCCESPIELDLARKRHVMGIFNDGDSRPYPDSCFFSLPEEYRWEVPVGLWRPVELEYTGPVLVERLALRPRLEMGVGRLDVEARLRNLDGRQMSGEVLFEAGGERGLRLRRDVRLPGGFEQTVEMSLSVPDAERWSPWRLGEAVLHDASLEVVIGGVRSARVSDEFGFRDVRFETGPGDWTLEVNGQPFFLRGANYTPGYELDRLTAERFREDIALARDANIDALRVHGHVLPEEFYREADRAGMVVLADLPLTGAYCYHAGTDDVTFFESAVRQQVPEMVGLLGNRPSVAAWIAHDDPPWIPAHAELGDVHAVRQDYTIDQEARALFHSLDPTRPALAASGEADAHVYAGWRAGAWQDFQDLAAPLLSEFGAQAPPDADSAAWSGLAVTWPVADEEPSWLYGGFQPAPWSERGAGLPSAYGSLAEFVAAGQDYQAALVAYAAQQMRRRKFEPCWGAFAYQLVDPHPGIGYGLLDFDRRPKAGYAALAAAFAPTRIFIDPTGFEPLDPFGFGYRPGRPLTARVVVVNDDPARSGPAWVEWSMQRVRAPELDRVGRLKDVVRRKSYGGTVEIDLPAAAGPSAQAALLSLSVDAEGDYLLDARLVCRGEVLDTAAVEVVVAADLPPARPLPLIPRYIASRLLVEGSLRGDAGSFSFDLENRLRPAVLTEVGVLELDGVPAAGGRVLVESPAGRVPIGRRLELPLGRMLRLHVEMAGVPASPGRAELALGVPGIATGRAAVEAAI